MKYTVKAHAKVNIGLRVLPKRKDGYHPLKSYFHLIGLHDRLLVDIEPADETSVVIFGNESYLEKGKTDLMQKAAAVFSDCTGIFFRLKIEIEKHIPHQAGLGGGSSDAAAILLTLNRHFSSPLSYDDLQLAALSLGSDVPFFTSGYAAAYAEGRGEVLTQVEAVDYPVVILMKKGDKMPTGEAFRLLDEMPDRSCEIATWPIPLSSWRGGYINDFAPFQRILKEADYRRLASLSGYDSVSGSGSACYLVFESAAAAEDFNIILNQLEIPYLIFFTGFCCKTLL